MWICGALANDEEFDDPDKQISDAIMIPVYRWKPSLRKQYLSSRIFTI